VPHIIRFDTLETCRGPRPDKAPVTNPLEACVSRGARRLTVVAGFLLACGLAASSSAAPGVSPAQDSDLDGLVDGFESYLQVISSNPAWDASPQNADTDGDGQPDGFEFCLSGRKEVVSPGVVHPVVPKLTLASYQQGSDILVSLYVVPGAFSMIDDFKMFVAAETPGSPAKLVNMTDVVGVAVSSIDFVWWGPYQMGVLTFRIPVETIRYFGTVAIGAVGRVENTKMGDSITLAWHNGKVFRWSYHSAKATEGNGANGEAEPQDPSAGGSEWVSDEVCGSVDAQVPTGTPGVLESVVQSLGCSVGTLWCNGGICSATGSAADSKLVLDVDLLLGL